MTYTFGVKITGTAGLLQSVVEESDREIAANLAKRVAVADNGATASDGSGGPSESSGATHTWLKALEGVNKEIHRAYLSERGLATPQLRDEVGVRRCGILV
jgi:hypothetical protein